MADLSVNAESSHVCRGTNIGASRPEFNHSVSELSDLLIPLVLMLITSFNEAFGRLECE